MDSVRLCVTEGNKGTTTERGRHVSGFRWSEGQSYRCKIVMVSVYLSYKHNKALEEEKKKASASPLTAGGMEGCREKKGLSCCCAATGTSSVLNP